MRTSFRVALGLFLVLIVGTVASGPSSPDASAASYDFASTDALASSIVTNGAMAGGVLVISNEEGVLLEKSYGAFTPTLLLPVYSSGKWVAGATIMTLVDDGLINLDAPISTYLPTWVDAKGAITVRQLFSHTSGMVGTHACLADINITLAACVDQIYLTPLAYPSGTVVNYGGVSMQVGARIAEVVTGQTWAQLFAERITAPLGMSATYYYGNANPSIGAGLLTTASEYTRFLRMLLRGGELDGTTVLTGGAVAEMHTNYNPPGMPNVTGGHSRFAVGNWVDVVGTPGNPAQNSSFGGGGTTPWINWDQGYAGIFLLYTAAPATYEFGVLVKASANAATVDGDEDQVGDTIDNCVGVENADQLNTDGMFWYSVSPASPPVANAPPGDRTRPVGDAMGDACDPDDDNDGITDAVEGSLGVPSPPGPCVSASAPLEPRNHDTDSDGAMDSAECTLETNPANGAVRPTAAACAAHLGVAVTADTDGDGIRDGVEFCGYGSSRTVTDTDGDGCEDGLEIASVDTNSAVNSTDLLIVALQFSHTDRLVQDVDKNGIVNSSDLLLVALNFGKTC